MARITATNDEYVTLGVTDKDLRPHTDLRSVTFTDHNGTPHTVHAHKDGPFGTPDEIVNAWEQGALHPFADHDTAIAYHSERENGHVVADAIKAYRGDDTTTQHQSGGGY